MPPIVWIVGFIFVAVLFWRASRSNKHHTRIHVNATSAEELAKENQRLRHVLAHISVENYTLRHTPPNKW